MRATVITDASFCPETKAAGWGCWVSFEGGRVKKSGNFKKTPKDNNIAELWALVIGAYFAIQSGAKTILLQSDNMFALNQIQRRYRKTPTDLFGYNITGIELNTRHVKGHSKNKDSRSWCNRWCDKRAGEMMHKQRNIIHRGE